MRKLTLWLLVLVLTGALAGALTYALRPYVDAAGVLGSITKQRLPATALPTFTATPTPQTPVLRLSPTATVPPIKNPSGVTNYLLLASDTDAKFNANRTPGTAPDTQVMIFVSFDTVHQQLSVVSIPRDLYIQIPGYGIDKIYTAAEYGDLALSVKTVETTFNVSINHYAWVGLKGFVGIINALGGVDIDVAHPMIENEFPDDLAPSGDPYAIRRFYIPAGPQHLDGATALLYVRARHSDLIGDYGRQQRQQQLLSQLKTKLKSEDLLTIAPALIGSLRDEFKTDLSLPELLGLGRSLISLPENRIHRYFLTQAGGYTSDSTINLPNGSQSAVLLPNSAKLNAFFACILSANIHPACQ